MKTHLANQETGFPAFTYNKKKCYVDKGGLFQKVVSYKLSHNAEF